MKHRFTALLLALLLLFTGCAVTETAVSKTEGESAPESIASETDAPSEPPYKIILAKDGKLRFTLVCPDGDAAVYASARAVGKELNEKGVKLNIVKEGASFSGIAVYLGDTVAAQNADISVPEGKKGLITAKDGNVFVLGDGLEAHVLKYLLGAYSDGEGKISLMSDTYQIITEAMAMVTPEVSTVRVPGLEKEYSILHLTDMHVCLVDEDTTDARKNYNSPRVGLFSKGGVTSAERYPYFFDYAEEIGAVAMVLTGDITDQPSDANIALLKNEISASNVPVNYVVGNHDWCYYDDYWTENAKNTHLYPKFSDISGGSTEYGIEDHGEFAILTVNNSMNSFTPAHLTALDEAFALNKPIVLAMHIPISAPELKEASKKVWGGRDITIGVGGVGDNDTSFTFIDRVTSPDSPVIAILAGHVHFSHIENIGNIPQFVTNGGFDGACRILRLIPDITE